MESEEQGPVGVRSPLTPERAWPSTVRGALTELGKLFKHLIWVENEEWLQGLDEDLDGLAAPGCASAAQSFLWHLCTCFQMQLLLLKQDRKWGRWNGKGSKRTLQLEEPLESVRLQDSRPLTVPPCGLWGNSMEPLPLLRPQAEF